MKHPSPESTALEPPTRPGSTSLAGRAGMVKERAAFRARSVVGPLTARRRLAGSTRLHLGCGDHVLPGWANLDLLGFPGVVPWNLTRDLPVGDGTIDFIFSEHFIEHVTLEQAQALLRECHRVLRPGGVVRISTPDLRKLTTEYQAGRTSEWTDVDWVPATPCQMLNEGLRSWGHLFVFDPEELTSLFKEAGFIEVEHPGWRSSSHAPLRDLECRPFHDEIIVEATK